MKQFETIYRNATSFAKSKGVSTNTFSFYAIFRNEMNFEAGHSDDYICNCDSHISQAQAVFNKLNGSISLKNMCRQFYGTKVA